MIKWCGHPEPYTKNPSEKREQPEGFFAYPPPLVDGFEFIYPHDSIGDDIDEEEVGKHV